MFISTGSSHTTAKLLTVSHFGERCHQTCKCKVKNYDTITLAHSLNLQTRGTLRFQLPLHHLNITWNRGLNPKEKCQTLVDATPNELTTHAHN